MDSLDCLSNKCVRLLHSNRLIQPLLRNELIKNKLSVIKLDPKLESETLEKLKLSFGIKNEEEFTIWVKENNIDVEDFQNVALIELKKKKYCYENFSNQVESQFLKRKKDLDIIVYTLIRVKDFFLARELYHRAVSKEEDIGTLASLYSEGIEKKTRGIVGPVQMSSANEGLSKVLRNSHPGEIKGPILINEFFIITRVESYDPAELDEFIREKMAEELFTQMIESEINTLSQDILKKSYESN